MSYSFFVRLRQAPSVGVCLEAVRAARPGVAAAISDTPRSDLGGHNYLFQLDPGDPLDETLSLTECGHMNLFVPGETAAGVELSWDLEQGLRVRCMGLASGEDYDLALQSALALGDGSSAPVVTEEATRVTRASIDEYGPTWRDGHIAAAAGLALLNAKGKGVAIQTPLRPYYLGPATRKRLAAGSDSAKELLEALIRLVAYASRSDRAEYFAASIEQWEGIGSISPCGPSIGTCFTPWTSWSWRTARVKKRSSCHGRSSPSLAERHRCSMSGKSSWSRSHRTG